MFFNRPTGRFKQFVDLFGQPVDLSKRPVGQRKPNADQGWADLQLRRPLRS